MRGKSQATGQPFNIAVNCFRIDIPVASEGFLANAPEADHSDWEPSEVPAEGVVWMLQQPPQFAGNVVSMSWLRETEGIMASRVGRTAGCSGIRGIRASDRIGRIGWSD